jgi:uncharacterized membrane protein YgaE (UPF0421/DUF939 family)
MGKNSFIKLWNEEKVQGQETFFERTAVVWKTALGSAVSWEIAYLTGSHHPYLAPLTLILCLQATIGQSLKFAMFRSVGTIIGVLMIGSFAKFIPVTAWALAIALFMSMALMKLFRVNDQMVHQVALSILFVLYFENQSAGYAWDRAKDTLIGAIVGVLFVTLIFPPNELKQTEKALRRLVQHFVDTVNLVALALQQNLPCSERSSGVRLNELFNEFQQVSQLFDKVQEGLPFNIHANKGKTQRLEQQFFAIYDAFIHFVVLTQTFNEIMTPVQREQWSNRIQSLKVELLTILDGDSLASASSVTNCTTQEFNSDISEYELQKILHSLRRFSV